MGGGFAPAVLCYHAVTEEWKDALSVDLTSLERQLDVLLRLRFVPAPLEVAVDGRTRTLHVTFDDAFTNIKRAFPALERRAIPFTVFACTGFAVDGRPLDVPELRERRRGHEEALATMTWDELREIAERGAVIGSHTITHAHLPRFSDDELDRELRASREEIEDELAAPCRYLAYPFGDEDARVRTAAARAGYEAAFALPGTDRPLDRFALPRIGIFRGDGRARTVLKSSRVARRLAFRARARRR